MSNNHPKIAVVGMAFRFPGDISNSDQLWDALSNEQCLVTSVKNDRWGTETYLHPRKSEPGKSYTWSAGLLSRIDEFDADFFGISPREAQQMDPQQRLLLELTWEALEDGGQKPEDLAGSDCAVHIGIASNDYLQRRMDDLSSADSYTMTGITASIASNRISYVFDLHGPSMSIDTACSSSLVALHQACQSIWSGEASMAVTGGVNMLLSPFAFVGFSKASMLSPTGLCRSFDADGDGYVRSEGAAILYLKPLDKAEADGDNIHAVITATGVNCDGQTNGITVPNPEGQGQLLSSIYDQEDLDIDDIDYFEAHGTGTPVGDPIETSTIGNVLGVKRSKEKPLLIGSVKSNMGHLETASGMAGMVKVIHCLKNKAIPASINFKKPNPNIDFDGLNLKVVDKFTALPQKGSPLKMGVNSFGFGGANAHVLMEEYCPDPDAGSGTRKSRKEVPPLLLTANSRDALRDMASNTHHLLTAAKSLTKANYYNVAYAYAFKRQRLEHGVAISGGTEKEVVRLLKQYADGNLHENIQEVETLHSEIKTAFVFSGNGSQYVGMGKQLYEANTSFKKSINKVDKQFQKYADFSIVDELYADEENSRLQLTEVAQPLLFALQVGLVELLGDWGIKPSAVVGHSVGEIAAAWASGALSLKDAVWVIYERSQAQGLTRGTGRMAAAGLSPENIYSILDELQLADIVEVSGFNSPNNVTISGPLSALQTLEDYAAENSIFYRLLDLDYAFHSRYMDPVKDRVHEALAALAPGETSVDYYSTVSGALMCGTELTASYWWENIKKPVQFTDAIGAMLDEGYNYFLEISSHPVLRSYLKDSVRGKDVQARIAPTLFRKSDDVLNFTKSVNMAMLLGVPVNVENVFPVVGDYVSLPAYPWQKERHWYELTSEGYDLVNKVQEHPLLGARVMPHEPKWENHLDTDLVAYLSDHVVGNATVFPAAGYVEMALAASQSWYGNDSHDIDNLEIFSPLLLDEGHTKTVRFALNPDSGDFTIQSRARLSNDPWSVNVSGRIAGKVLTDAPEEIDINAQISSNQQSVLSDEHYRYVAAMGLSYGPAFQALNEIWVDGDQAFARLKLPNEILPGLDHHHLHPTLLDACFQAIAPVLKIDISKGDRSALIPVRVGRLRYYEEEGNPAFFNVTITKKSPRSVLANFHLYSKAGHALATLEDCRFKAVSLSGSETLPSTYEFNSLIMPTLTDTAAESFPSIKSIVTNVQNQSANADYLAQRRVHYEEVIPLVDIMLASFAYDTFSRLGVGYDSFTIDSLLKDAYIDHRYKYLLARLLQILQEDGIAQSDDESWSLFKRADLPDVQDIWMTLIGDYPAYLAELTLAASCGKNLYDILKGHVDHKEILQPAKGSSTIDHLYSGSPSYSGINHITASILQQLAGKLPVNRRLRILEISNGQTGLAHSILSSLPENQCDYVYAYNVDSDFQPADSEFAEYPFLTVESIDFLNDAECLSQLQENYFDVVIVNHVLHRAGDLARTVSGIAELMVTNGLFVLMENQPDRFTDLTFGLDPEWWRHSNDANDPVSLLLSADEWKSLLQQAQYQNIVEFNEPHADASHGAYILMANSTTEISSNLDEIKSSANWILMVGDNDVSRDLSHSLRRSLKTDTNHVFMIEVGDGFAQISQDCFTIRPTEKADYKQLLGELNKLNIDKPHFVHLLGLSEGNDTDFITTQDQRCVSTMLLVQAIAELSLEAQTSLSIVTSGASAIADGYEAIPSQATLWGLGRVIANEHPDINSRMIDIQPGSKHKIIASSLVRELFETDEDEVLLTDDARYVTRMQPSKSLATLTTPQDSDKVTLDFLTPGLLRNLYWKREDRAELASGHVEIETKSAGLNFRDVMYAMGLLSDEAVENGFSGPTLGMEFSGTIVAVADDVKDFKVGDDVIGFAPACFSTYITSPATAIGKKPEGWSYPAAASVPTTFFTAYYALHHLAQIQPGERVLIHGAAGGVGIAAIQLARYFGAEIFATAGTDEKRNFVSMMGVDHVLDSRSLSYADQIMEITNGEGIDIVLNSLAGEAITKNLAILKPFGRFLELGKRDFYENSKIGLRPFRNNITYYGIDADQLMVERPQLTSRVFSEMMELFDDEVLRPLPHRVFSANTIAEAFRYMQQSKQIGKIVVSFEDEKPVAQSRVIEHEETLHLSADKTYLVTGGLSGFGLQTARWLVEKGARSLVLMSRSGAKTTEAKEAVDQLEKQGVSVFVKSVDVTQYDQLSEVFSEFGTAMPELGGVVHAAMVIDDALIRNLDAERMHKVLSPKIVGAWNLHRLTEKKSLDLFVVYSSVTTFFGNPGQSNYVAGNMYLEALAKMRRDAGLPALSVCWGAISDVGFLARNEDVKDALESRMGSKPLSSAQALDMLEQLLLADKSGRAVIDFSWKNIQRYMPAAKAPKYSQIQQHDMDGSDIDMAEDFRETIAGMPSDEVQELVAEIMTHEICQILRFSNNQLPKDRSIYDLGMDSLMGMELVMAIEERFGINLPVMALTEGPTIERLSERITGLLLSDSDSGEPESSQGHSETVSAVASRHAESLSESEVERLAEKLASDDKPDISLVK